MGYLSKKRFLLAFIGIVLFCIGCFSFYLLLKENNTNKKHEQLIEEIKQSAYNYGLDNLDYFKQGYEMYISIDSLVTNGYLNGNNETKTLYIDNLTNEPFVGVIYIYYKDNELYIEYLENYNEQTNDNLLQKNISIILNNVSTNFIDISVATNGASINNYEYYLNDKKITSSISHNYTYNGLIYGVYKIKVIAYSNEQKYEDNIIVSLNQISLPTFDLKDNILLINYPTNINNYVYEYSFDQINWIKTGNKIEKININGNMNVSARVDDGYNQVTAVKEITNFDKKSNYQIEFDLNGGTGNIPSQQIEEGKLCIEPNTPVRSGYLFRGWYLNDSKYNFNTPVTSNIKLLAKWEKEIDTTYYTVIFDLNGGTGNIPSQQIEKGKLVDKPLAPTKSGYKFKGWYLNGQEFNLNSPITTNITLKAEYTIIDSTIPVLNYNFASNTEGKWIFINNPEGLYRKYLTDVSGKALYSDFINGQAEIYFEHYIKDDVSLKMKYAIRFYNPTSNNITLKINNCGTAITRGNGNTYIDTWKQYYGYSNCSIGGKSFTIGSGQSVMIYLNAKSTGSSWGDWVCNYTTSLPTSGIPTSVIDGVLNVTSSGRLNVETFMFEDINTIPSNSYDNSDNYIDTEANRLVYSGYYNKLPYLVANIKFNITDTTEVGSLPIKYKANTSARDNWYTHLSETFNDKDVFTGDIINLVNSNNPSRNWANYAVHYTENIILNNTTDSAKKIAYYVNSFYASDDAGDEKGSAIVAFPKDNSLNYSYKRNIIGKWHTNQVFEKVWEINVPANSQIIVPTEILLGGNSHGKIGRKVVLLD